MTTTTKVVFEFPTDRLALQWFDVLRADGYAPAGTDLFKADALDLQRGGDASTYIVRKTDERTHGRLRDAL